MRWPATVKPGSVSARLVSSVDLAPTFLSLAGVKPTANFVGTDFSPLLKDPRKVVREYVYAEHNWHDYEARSRAVRSERFKYIRHDYNDMPLTPPADAVKGTTFQEMRHLRDEGKLNATQMVIFQKRPKEELYDTVADPHELKNLVNDKTYAKTLTQLRRVLAQWGKEMDDRVPAKRTPDNADRETGQRLPGFEQKGPRVAPTDRKYLDVYDTSTFDVN